MLDAGGAIIEIFGSTGFVTTGDRASLDGWITTYGLNVTSVIDAPDSPLASLNSLTVRETLLIVEVPSMLIVWQVRGDTAGIQPPSVVAGINEMMARLQ